MINATFARVNSSPSTASNRSNSYSEGQWTLGYEAIDDIGNKASWTMTLIVTGNNFEDLFPIVFDICQILKMLDCVFSEELQGVETTHMTTNKLKLWSHVRPKQRRCRSQGTLIVDEFVFFVNTDETD